MAQDPFAQFVSYLLGDLNPPKINTTVRLYVDGKLARANDTTRQEIMAIIKNRGALCSQEIIFLSGHPKTTVYKLLDELKKNGYIEAVFMRDLTTSGRAIKHYILKGK